MEVDTNIVPKQEEIEFVASFCTASEIRDIIHGGASQETGNSAQLAEVNPEEIDGNNLSDIEASIGAGTASGTVPGEINDNDSDASSDDVMFIDEFFPLPLLTDDDGQTKRQNDVMSGNIPFTTTVYIKYLLAIYYFHFHFH